MVLPTLRDWLAERPFALAMSSGFFGFFAHTGVLTALGDAALAPSRLAGSSAGALVSGLWAAGLDATRLRDELLALERGDFWDPGLGLGLLKGELFRDLLNELLPVSTFAACRVPLAITVFDLFARQSKVIDRGTLAPAIQASCTVPFLFQPLWHEGRPLLDGGIADRPGLDGLHDADRVLHHHLASRSPWRRKASPALAVPKRTGLTALVIDALPRVGPFRLERGAAAFELARTATMRALSRPIEQGVVRM
jgi:NTE family protein